MVNPAVSLTKLVPVISRTMAIAKNMYAKVRLIFIISYTLYIGFKVRSFIFAIFYLGKNAVEKEKKPHFTAFFFPLLCRYLYLV